MDNKIWKLIEGNGPLVAAAIHDGHEIRENLHGLLALDEPERLREEDPYTAAWTEVAETRVIGLRSRFEVDLNRPRQQAVYLKPEDAWGLSVWKRSLLENDIEGSLAEYDAFYTEMRRLFERMKKIYGHFIVFDIHTYNHRRAGPDAPAADPGANPEVNVGTGTLDRDYWSPVVDRFLKDLRSADFMGRKLDVRENVKFMGGGFSRYIHENFPYMGCALAIEFKKFFMDEWTGKLDEAQHRAIGGALRSTVPGLLRELEKLDQGK